MYVVDVVSTFNYICEDKINLCYFTTTNILTLYEQSI